MKSLAATNVTKGDAIALMELLVAGMVEARAALSHCEISGVNQFNRQVGTAARAAVTERFDLDLEVNDSAAAAIVVALGFAIAESSEDTPPSVLAGQILRDWS